MRDATAWRGRLRGARGDAPAWGYRPGGPPAAEPTALAGLALAAHAGAQADPDAASAAAWLASRQREDGSIAAGTDAGRDAPGWPTALACVLWRATGAHADARARATAWLVRRRGETMPVTPDQIVGHDTSLPGWSWVEATHSFLEPTAWALLALRGEAGAAAAERVALGIRLIDDRAVADGGWNYGNTTVYGRALRAQPAPTGLALVALSACGAEARSVGPALAYLARVAPTLRAPVSLGWALLGLRAWGRGVVAAEGLIAAALARAEADPTPVVALSVLALADATGGPGVLGARAGRGDAR
jgi:hypothetical protein